jgi:hypothetical protein
MMMKKSVSLLIALFLIGGINMYAQETMDAYKYSQSDLHGTARFSSMAGAFGALGGDISSMTTNPAGLGIYRSSEVVATLNLSNVSAQSNWSGSKVDQSKTKFNFDNIAYVGYFPTGNYSGIKGWNVGFGYNRIKNFARNYKISGTQEYSLSDYIAEISNDLAVNNSNYTGDNLWLTDDYNPFNQGYNPLSVAGYSGGLIGANNPVQTGGFYNPFSDNTGFWPIENANLEVIEKGAIDQYDFAVATNISDVLFLGATFVLTDIDYKYRSIYNEDFGYGDYSQLYNARSTEGNAYSFNVGAIVRPIDYLRLGLAYNSPTWYKLTDYNYVEAVSSIEDDEISVYSNDTPNDYHLRTADRWIFSAAGIIGQYGLVSVDYELTNYINMKLTTSVGFEYVANDRIKEDFGASGTLRIGAEAKITPQFSIRAGGAWMNSPVKAHVKDATQEIYVSGTIPHYTVDRGTNYYTVGFGYRFTPQFYVDLACVYKEYKEDVYAFSNIFYEDNKGDVQTAVASTPASMKTKTTRVALTFGYKF